MLNHLASMEDDLSRAKRVLKYTLLKVDWPQYTLKKKKKKLYWCALINAITCI